MKTKLLTLFLFLVAVSVIAIIAIYYSCNLYAQNLYAQEQSLDRNRSLNQNIYTQGQSINQEQSHNQEQSPKQEQTEKPNQNYKKMKKTSEIYLAGGCFWGTEHFIKQINGVLETQAGYANGKTVNPSYEQVVHDNTGHAETVKVVFDPTIVDLTLLLELYFKSIDPTVLNRQGNDSGIQYRTGIYYVDPTDLGLIQAEIKKQSANYPSPIVVEVLPLKNFYSAEDYHQDFLDKNPNGYCHISPDLFDFAKKANQKRPTKEETTKDSTSDNTLGSTQKTTEATNSQIFGGMQETLGSVQKPTEATTAQTLETMQNTLGSTQKNKQYSKADDAVLRKQLTPLQYEVTQKSATERPFKNEYNDEFSVGIYVDITTGEPLFISTDKFESGCGWPAFSKPIEKSLITEVDDNSLGRQRIEVRSKTGDAHLGHVFTDGPRDKGGLRYCINSASLRFVPMGKMEEEGYGEYIKLISK